MEHALLCPPSKKAEQQELALKVFDDDNEDNDNFGENDDNDDDGDDSTNLR